MQNNKIFQQFEITLSSIGKKFNNTWVFKNIDLVVQSGDYIAVNGNNGSGKSTFLQIIAGYVTPNNGEIKWSHSNNNIPSENIYKHLSIASPYIDLIEEFSLLENVEFFCRMKPLQNNMGIDDVIKIADIKTKDHAQVKHFSSGMKQRLKIALAMLSKTDILLLDEPLSNLDSNGFAWYKSLYEQYLNNRIVFVCSNQVIEETAFCNKSINIEDYKSQKSNLQ